jgi:sodium/hydrogen exchanger 8
MVAMRGTLCVAALLCAASCAFAAGPSTGIAGFTRPRASRALVEEGAEPLDAEEAAAEKEAEAEEESNIKWEAVVAILALGATFMGGYVMESFHIHWMPEAAVGLLCGVAVAFFTTSVAHNEVMEEREKFDFEFFMTWLLPPIIFEAGYNMNVAAFIANLGPTMFYAFIGTFASTFVVGGIVYQAGQMGLCYPLGGLAALLFGSLISATDPVTVLAVFQALGVKVDLFSMVFGESVLNDAVAIVLSRTLLGFNAPGTVVDAASVQAAGVSFCVIFGGSLLIGAVYGIASAIVFKAMDMRHHDELLFMQV